MENKNNAAVDVQQPKENRVAKFLKEKLLLVWKGVIKENPTFVLILSNVFISLIKNLIPDKVRIPAFIVVIASFVTVIQMLMQAFVPSLYESLGLFIPLIVVNCIVLGRAEAYASKNSVVDSALDGIGIGLGFTVSLTVIGFVRELLGGLSVFGNKLVDGDGMLAFVLAPGAFLVLGYLMVLFNKAKK